MEIGSIYEIDPGVWQRGSETAEAGRRLRLVEVEKYRKKHISYTASGREAIALALKSLEENRRDVAKRCLLPAYMCDTVFFPFERAGWEIYFYHIDRKMCADTAEIDRLIEQVRPGLIFIHPYYGVDTWKSARSLLHEWKAQGICIMEDMTQSYYLENAGLEADYCVGSLRKWYAVPDGGFVASDEALSEIMCAGSGESGAGANGESADSGEKRETLDDLRSEAETLTMERESFGSNEIFVRTRREMMTRKWEYLHGQGDPQERRALKEDYLKKNREMEAWLDDYAGISAMSDESAYILSLEDEAACRERRRENLAYLHKELARLNEKLACRTQFVPVFDTIQGAASLYYPVYAGNRDELQRFLAVNGVYAPTLWPIGKENADCLSEDERYIYEHILALPIDQRYGIEEMRRVVEVLEQYEEEKATGADKRVIGIRVDANEEIATGHVMRCITIAKQLAASACRVIFYTADEYAGELLGQTGMEYVCLHTRWDKLEEEIPLLREELKKAGCKKLLVDSYQVTERYFDSLRDICRLIYIDDCFEGIYPVDMVINYNAYHVRFPYEEAYAGKAKLLLGTAYVPLREEFGGLSVSEGADEKCETDEKQNELKNDTNVIKERVLLSSGGGDQCNALAGILGAAVRDNELRNVIFHTVVGGFNRNVEELERLAEEHSNIRLHHRVEYMAQLMGECTAAVSAAGTMLFELSAMQVPTVFFVSADNQQYDSEFFAKEERMLFAGDIREERERCLEEVCRQLKQLLKDERMRERMKKKLHEVTDGQGAKRIAAGIIQL